MLLILNLWNDVLFCGGAIIGRPFLVSKISYETAPSTSLFFLLATNGRRYIHFSQGRSLAARFQFPKLRTRRRPRRPFFLPSFPFPHSNTLRQADRLALFINLLHLCRSCYPLFFVCDRRRNPNLTLFLSSLYCFQFRHFRLLHRLRKPYTFHLF